MKKERPLKRTRKSLQEFWIREQSLTILLMVLLAYIFLIIPIIHRNLSGQIIFFIFYFLLLSSGWPFLKGLRMPWLIWVLILFPFAFLFNELYTLALWERVAADLFIIGYSLLLCWILLRRTFAEGPITGYRIQGSIAVYLLIAFSFAMMFHAITLLEGTSSFKGSISSYYNYREYMYFSMTTLTTTGYGDIVPAASLARSLANLEALIGQLYPAVLIARLVSMELVSSQQK